MAEAERQARVRAGDAIRPGREKNVRLRRAVAVAGLVVALALTIATPFRPLLVWNASASMPTGLYRVGAPQDIAIGEIVVARVPPVWRPFADARHYVPATVPLVKRVAAVAGATVCAAGPSIFINGQRRARRRIRDGQGRTMPWWQGCTRLRGGAIFLLGDSPASFDGRYFGPTDRNDVVGRAHPLWTR